MQRMNAASILLAFVALLFGLLGVYAFRNWASRTVARPAEAPQKTLVPMASRGLPSGQTVTLSDVALVKLTKEQMQQRGISGMFMSDPQQIIGQTVMTSIPRGATFHTQQFYPQGFRPNVADLLEPGQRAVTVLVSSENALNGFANAGQLVDVIFRVAGGAEDDVDSPSSAPLMWEPRLGYHARSRGAGFRYTYDDRTGSSSQNPRDRFASTTVTLMQGIKVLALEKNTVQQNAQEVPDSSLLRVTLAVTPDQAETLRVVEGHGVLSLSLRNPHDREVLELVDAKELADILGRPASPNRRTVDQMEVYRGGEMTRLEFDGNHPLAVRFEPKGSLDAVPKADAANYPVRETAVEVDPSGDSRDPGRSSTDVERGTF